MSARRIAVRATPNAHRSEVVGWEPAPPGTRGHDRVLRVRLAAPPIEGRANEELVRLLAGHCGVPKSGIRLVAGAASRLKFVELPEGVEP